MVDRWPSKVREMRLKLSLKGLKEKIKNLISGEKRENDSSLLSRQESVTEKSPLPKLEDITPESRHEMASDVSTEKFLGPTRSIKNEIKISMIRAQNQAANPPRKKLPGMPKRRNPHELRNFSTPGPVEPEEDRTRRRR